MAAKCCAPDGSLAGADLGSKRGGKTCNSRGPSFANLRPSLQSCAQLQRSLSISATIEDAAKKRIMRI